MTESISLKGLDKAAVFAALYNGAKAPLFQRYIASEPMTTEQAQKLCGEEFGYFDYVGGRVMKVDLSGDMLDPRLYDRDNGNGAAMRIIRELRSRALDE